MSNSHENRERAASIFRSLSQQGIAPSQQGIAPGTSPPKPTPSKGPGRDVDVAEGSGEPGNTAGRRVEEAEELQLAATGLLTGEERPGREPKKSQVGTQEAAQGSGNSDLIGSERLRTASQGLAVTQDLGQLPAERPPLPRVIAIANQKGGVGKTTTAVNLGAALAELGYRALVVDLDPQGNATTGLGVNARNLEASIYDVVLHDVPIEDCIEATNLRNLFLVPATIDLAGAEIELVPAFSRELRLKRAIGTVLDDFDFLLIDCPPSLGLLTVNALAAATEVAVPIQCEYYALEGLGQLLRNIERVRANLNPVLAVTTIIMTMFDARTRLAEQVVAEVRSHFGERVCRTVVPRTVRLSEAPSFGQPIIVFDPSSRGATAYRELAKEVCGGAPQRSR
jgi:chromosome partitioning protein